MDNYLVGRETLEQFVDALISQKFPNQPSANFGNLKEDAIASLDARISNAVFGDLDATELASLNSLLDQDEQNPQVFKDFFEKSGINLEEKIREAMTKFKLEFLGGENA